MRKPLIDLNQIAEDRWTTVRTAVWQGWEAHQVWTNHWWQDEDGGVWAEARPDLCDIDKHLPRWHPAEIGNHFYCIRCGKQGIADE